MSLNMSGDNPVEKVLGMYWNAVSDQLIFDFKFHRVDKEVISLKRSPTKRELLSITMSIFDPFGLIADFTIHSKLLVQELWRTNIDWDDPIPKETHSKWKMWREELGNVKNFFVPRCYSPQFLTANEIQIHVFVDASEVAFASCAYFRIVTNDNQVHVVFIAGKTKCAPRKLLSIPRLELQSAILGTRLYSSIIESHEITVNKRVFWSDSNTVIQRIHSDHRKYKPFVAHRISEILDSTDSSNWRWVPTSSNPADAATRAKYPPKFNVNGPWIKGPEFLLLEENDWPKPPKHNIQICKEEIRTKHRHSLFAHTNSFIINIDNFSKYLRLVRVTAWLFRYFHNCYSKSKQSNVRSGELSVVEINEAVLHLCKIVQSEYYKEEYDRLKSGKSVDKSSCIYQLSPYLDENDVIRIHGRIDNAEIISEEMRRPIILPNKHYFTELVVMHYHELMRHQNHEAIICEVRRKFWIPRIRQLVKTTKSKCQFCKIQSAKPVPPLMGQLPVDRLTPYVRPFTYCGLDYFGPFTVTIGRRREKRWGAIFTCLTIRAVHLELATDLSTDACLLCIRNFINRRGVPKRIRSDNGTNFVGVKSELQGVDNFLDHEVIKAQLSVRGIEWVFNCPSNPHAGGCWERLVQSVKRVLVFNLKEIASQVETLRSFLIEAENIVNCRPLTHVPVESYEDEPLTPNHFLLGTANSTQTPGMPDEKFVYRKQWRIAQQLKNSFWKRWIAEYLPELTKRSKWYENVAPVKIGDLVIICDSEVSRNQWKRGIITNTYPGRDGQVRVVEVKTSSGVLKRPASKVAVLDVSKSSTTIYGAGNVDDQ